MKQFKCPWCKRETELNEDVVVYTCVCGEGFDLREDDDGGN